jgi:hypothetical protein
MSGRRYATCSCELCHLRVPKNEAHQDFLLEESGSSIGSSRPRYVSTLKHFFKSQRASERTYYKKRKIWICTNCIDRKNEIDIQNKQLKKKLEKQYKTGKLPYVLFWSIFWLFVILIMISK